MMIASNNYLLQFDLFLMNIYNLSQYWSCSRGTTGTGSGGPVIVERNSLYYIA